MQTPSPDLRVEAVRRSLDGVRRPQRASAAERRDMRQENAYLAGREPRRMEREAAR